MKKGLISLLAINLLTAYCPSRNGVMSSDAICSGAGSATKGNASKKGKNSNCNALLKAANRC
ncbi:hypothetical protein [Pasteurella sp. PK-2025]|uniref:hypothetical protein n=1 Tax=unclassified Pasteurella TaxID=2621516 RepID=UPI003C768D30